MVTHKILVGSFTDSIYILEFDPRPSQGSPTLKYVSKVHVGPCPSWIEAHPTDKSLVLAAVRPERADGQIVVVRFDQDGKGHKIEEATCPSGGASPCTLLVTEDEVIVGNYSSGTVGVVPISLRPPYTRPAEVWSLPVPFEAGKPGRDLSRQEAAHPHQVVVNPLNTTERELLVPDLGSDRVWQFTKGADGRWAIRGFVNIAMGGGPRHVAAYGDTLYVLLELTSEIAVYKYHGDGQLWAHVTTLSTLRASPMPGRMWPAEILIPTPNRAFPAVCIYASNRGDTHPEGDTIAIFSHEKGEERPELVTEVRTGLRHVRGMVFGGEHDQWLIVGGMGRDASSEEGAGIKMYERTEGGKGLRQVAELNDDIVKQMRATAFVWL